MSAGIYKLNGNYAYAMDLEKKLKRKKNAEIIEIFNGSEQELQNLLTTKYNKVKEKENREDEIKKYYFTNGKETIVSIYPTLDNLKSIININEWYEKTSVYR